MSARNEVPTLKEIFESANRTGRKYQDPEYVEGIEQSISDSEVTQDILGGIDPEPCDPDIQESDIAAFECRFLVD